MRFGKVYAMAVVPPSDEIRRRSYPPCLRLPRHRNSRPGRRAPRGGFHYTDIDPGHSRRLPCGRVSGASTEGREGSPWSGQPCSVSRIRRSTSPPRIRRSQFLSRIKTTMDNQSQYINNISTHVRLKYCLHVAMKIVATWIIRLRRAKGDS